MLFAGFLVLALIVLLQEYGLVHALFVVEGVWQAIDGGVGAIGLQFADGSEKESRAPDEVVRKSVLQEVEQVAEHDDNHELLVLETRLSEQ